jgi:nitroreductase / dihydropteridine reductase
MTKLSEVARRRHTAKAYDPTRTIPQATIDELLDVLRHAPSSVNSQPWHFVVAASAEAKARIAGAAAGGNAYNAPKITDASHVIVFASRLQMTDAHMDALLAQEAADGRFPVADARTAQVNGRRKFVDLHRYALKDAQHWMEKQTYLALGTLLLAAGYSGVDATPMEGFDPVALDAELGLHARGYTSVVVVALGYHGEADVNARTPKSRLPADAVFTHL